MKISVVTINYNQADYIENTIQSVISQSYKNFEYIVIDGGSTDESVEIIKKYEKDISYWVSEKDDGPSHALNKGFKQATGELYFYLNSDDNLRKDAFINIINFIQQYPEYDVYYGHGYVRDVRMDLEYPFYSDLWNTNHFLNGKISVFQPSTFIKKDIYQKTNGFNTNNKTCWDAELLIDCVIKGAKLKRSQDFYAEFTLHHNSITGSQKLKEQYLRDFDTLKLKTKYTYNSGFFINIKKLFIDPKIVLLKIGSKIKKKYIYGVKRIFRNADTSINI